MSGMSLPGFDEFLQRENPLERDDYDDAPDACDDDDDNCND